LSKVCCNAKNVSWESYDIVEVQLVVETQIITADVNVVDFNATTRSKVNKKHVFKDRKLRKQKMLRIGKKKSS